MKAKGFTRLRRGIIAFCAVQITWMAFLGFAGAANSAQVKNLEIPPQDVSSALKQFANQTETQIMFSPSGYEGITTNGVSGQYSVDDGLRLLLKDTDLTFEFSDDDMIVVYNKPQKTSFAILPDGERNSTGGLNDAVQESQAVAAAADVSEDDVAEGKKTSLEQIVVTADKTSRDLQKTSLSIVALTKERLQQSGIAEITDVQFLVPNLVVANVAGDAVVTIRGIGSQVVSAGTDPSSSIHLDGVYVPRPTAAFFDFLDVERLEVLRGPQGTLYGRNAVGGTINIITGEPGNEWEFAGDAEYQRFETTRFRGLISGPIVEDRFMARVAVMKFDTDGEFNNLTTGTDFGRDDVFAVRASTKLVPDQDLSVLLRLDYTSEEGDMLPLIARGTLIPPPLANPDGGFFDLNFDTPNTRDGEQLGVSGTIDWDAGPFSVRSITGYRDTSTDRTLDQDATSLPARVTDFNEDSKQFTEEFQLQSSGDGRFEWLLAFYYLHEDANLLFRTDINPTNDVFVGGLFGLPFGIRLIALGVQDVSTNAYAGFGNFGYAVNDWLRLRFGIRYSKEKKTIVDGQGTPFLFPGSPPDVVLDSLTSRDDWDAVTPRFVVELTPNDDLFLYASAARGFKSGGFNFRIGSPDPERFDPEFVWTYEVGGRANWFDDRLRTNLTFFYSDFTDQQIQVIVPNPDPLLPGMVATQNAGKSEIKGIEFEMEAAPVERLRFDLAAAYLNAKFSEFMSATRGDLAGLQMADSPKWTISLGGQYTAAVGNLGDFTLRGELQWRADNPQNINAIGQPFLTIDDYALVNLRGTFVSEGGHWRLTVWATNLANKEYELVRALGGLAASISAPGSPRSFGVQLGFQY